LAPYRAGGQPLLRRRRRAGRSQGLLCRRRVYKTTDGGVHWQPIFDDQPVQSIGALAVAQSDPNIVWAGTGEGKIRSHISIGQGIYKSMDAGKTWTLMGLERTGRIPRIVIHPRNPDVVFACALGHAYGPQPERGVFRTTDGGRTWSRVLFVDENTGCSDIAMDPTNPRVLFAGMWQLEIHTWGRESGGPGSGLFVSRDGGETWSRITGRGLPARPVGKVAVAIAPSNPNRVYALIETGDGIPWKGQPTDSGQVFRSDDGGANWTVVSYDRNAMGRAHYYSRMAVAPDNENETYYLTASFSRSIDGGRTLTVVPRGEAPGGDHHDIWIDPTDANRMIVGHLVPPAPHQRPDVSRDHRQRNPVQRPGQQAGRALLPRAEQQPPGRARRHSARHVAFRGRRRERLGHPRSHRFQHHLVDGVGFGHGRRHRGALRGEPAAVPQRRGLARPVQRSGGGRQVPLRLGRSLPHIAA